MGTGASFYGDKAAKNVYGAIPPLPQYVFMAPKQLYFTLLNSTITLVDFMVFNL
jgi:hypothetical protein